MIRRPPRSTLSSSSAASDVYKRQVSLPPRWPLHLVLQEHRRGAAGARRTVTAAAHVVAPPGMHLRCLYTHLTSRSATLPRLAQQSLARCLARFATSLA